MKHWGKALFGVAVTVLLLWWALRDVSIAEVWTNVRGGNMWLLLASVSVATFGFFIRALRWKVLLAPLGVDTSVRSRFAGISIGFMANNTLPARMGEFIRAYSFSRLEPVSVGAAFGSLVVERFLDGVVLLLFLVLPALSAGFPAADALSQGWGGVIFQAAIIAVVAVMVLLSMMAAWPRQLVRVAEWMGSHLPEKIAGPVIRGLETFLDAIAIMRDPKLLFLGFAWTLLFWTWHAVSFWLGMLAFGIDTGFVSAVFVEAVVGFGVAIPAAPGFIGTFHASAKFALSDVYGVADPEALRLRVRLSLRRLDPDHRYRALVRMEARPVDRGRRCRRGAAREGGPTRPRGRPALRRPRLSQRATVLAPAKVNLALHVYGRRPDGYHEIDTLFQAIDLCDEVEVELGGEGMEVEVEGADLGPQEENLAYKAAVRFLSESVPGATARVHLVKRIPHGAGLGGGSSDAAAVLRCLADLVGGVEDARLHAIGAELGSDVPFFLGRSPIAQGRSRGELLEAFPALPAADLVLVSPPVHVATAEAYRALAASRGGGMPVADSAPPLRLRSWQDLEGVARNDFEPVMAAAHPEIGRALATLRAGGASVALMTGSGSTCFGLFAGQSAALAAADVIAGELGWPSTAVRSLNRLPSVRRV